MEKMKQFFVDKLDVRVFPTREEMGLACAAEACEKIRGLLAEKESVSIIFASAPSQLEVLAGMLAQKELDWSRIYAFHMDEYVGLPANAPQSFGNYLRTRFFSKLPFKQVYYIDGNAQDIAGECERYEALLYQHPVDISFLGIGENGHLAFNDPEIADFHDPLLVKLNANLDAICRQQQVTDGWFRSLADVPDQAITITLPALVAARYVYAVVPGRTKQKIVRECLEGPVGTKCPATILRQHDTAQLYLDADSAALVDPTIMESLTTTPLIVGNA